MSQEQGEFNIKSCDLLELCGVFKLSGKKMVKIDNLRAIYFEDVEERSWIALTNSLRGKGFMKTISKSLSLRSQGVPEIPMTGVNCLSELRMCRTISLPLPPCIRISVITRSKRPSSNFFIPSFTSEAISTLQPNLLNIC